VVLLDAILREDVRVAALGHANVKAPELVAARLGGFAALAFARSAYSASDRLRHAPG
jgi:hypothetical protein